MHDAHRLAMLRNQKVPFAVADAMLAGARALEGQCAPDQALVKTLRRRNFLSIGRMERDACRKAALLPR
jgi:hypothetical protein